MSWNDLQTDFTICWCYANFCHCSKFGPYVCTVILECLDSNNRYKMKFTSSQMTEIERLSIN